MEPGQTPWRAHILTNRWVGGRGGGGVRLRHAGVTVTETSVQGHAGYAATTRDITVSVLPYFLEDQSVPDAGHYVWAYHVRIQNDGTDIVQLLTRHWIITDSQGHVHEVRGEGVIGKQPVLRPGEAFEYASGTPLPTPSEIMMGTYQMQGAERRDVRRRNPGVLAR